MGMHVSPSRAKSRRRQRKREERRWERKSGKVVASFMPCPDCGEPHDRREDCPKGPRP